MRGGGPRARYPVLAQYCNPVKKLWPLVLAFAALGTPPPASASLALVQEWGSPGSGNGQFNEPTDVAAAPNGDVYVSDRENHRIQKFTNGGQFLLAWGGFGTGNGQFNAPMSVAVDAAGDVYVTDRGNTRVQKFNPDGVFLTAWGEAGTGPGQFGAGSIWGVATDAARNVYVNDSGTSRIQKFAPDGTFVTAFAGPGSEPGQLAFPHGMSFDGAGNLHVADRDNHRVQVFTPDGQLVRVIGTRGSGQGELNAPFDVVPDGTGHVYVGEENTLRIQRFTLEGAFVSLTGALGTVPNTTFVPWGMGADSQGNVFIADRPRHRVLKAREGEPVPELGETVAAAVVSGTVLVQVPAGAARAAQTGGGFVRLTGASEIPVGSILDTTRGVVRLTAAKDRRGGTQTGNFYSGVFQMRQRPGQALVDLVLRGRSVRSLCSRSRKAGAARHGRRVRRLWGNGRGRFRTRGRYSAATVRGTQWLVEDGCNGTLTRVRSGRVAVRDFVRHRTVRLRAGQSYLARTRR